MYICTCFWREREREREKERGERRREIDGFVHIHLEKDSENDSERERERERERDRWRRGERQPPPRPQAFCRCSQKAAANFLALAAGQPLKNVVRNASAGALAAQGFHVDHHSQSLLSACSRLKKLEHGCRIIYACFSYLFGLG